MKKSNRKMVDALTAKPMPPEAWEALLGEKPQPPQEDNLLEKFKNLPVW